MFESEGASLPQDPCKSYDEACWDRERFASKHIVFPVRNGKCDFIEEIVRG